VEQRTLLFIVLSLGIWYGWLTFFPPPEPPADPAEQVDGDGVASAGADGQAPSTDPDTRPPAPSTGPVASAPDPGSASLGPEVRHERHSCDVNYTWSSRGGGLSDLTLDGFQNPYDVTPLYSWALGGFGSWSPYGDDPGPARVLTDQASTFTLGAGDPLSQPAELTWSGDSADDGVIRARGATGVLSVEQEIRLVPATDTAPCHYEATYTWTAGSSAYAGPVWVGVHDVLPAGGGGMMARYTSQSGASALINGEVWTLYDYEELEGPTEVEEEGKAGWFGIADRYFAAYLVPDEEHGAVLQTRVTRPDAPVPLDGLTWNLDVDLAPGASHTETMKLYIGPKDLDVLNAVDEDLGYAVELGWFSFFARPLLWMLKLFYNAVGNWGLSIILLTLTVKTVFFPLTQSAFRSGQAMQAIQPQLQEIREAYKDDQEQLNRRTMELFRENKVNPLGGCLPMLIQFPVWIALYNVLLSSVELYQTEFLYLRDLSSADPYGVLPIIVVGLIMLQQQFTPTGNMDPAQARMMKLMPLMFGIFFFTFPSGLVVYIFVNTVLSVLQQWFIRRTYTPPEGAVPAT
jgi:YidC/Oxa1 family membrane protein insertase